MSHGDESFLTGPVAAFGFATLALTFTGVRLISHVTEFYTLLAATLLAVYSFLQLAHHTENRFYSNKLFKYYSEMIASSALGVIFYSVLTGMQVNGFFAFMLTLLSVSVLWFFTEGLLVNLAYKAKIIVIDKVTEVVLG